MIRPHSTSSLSPSSVRRSRSAFTLVELLVVLSLIVLALAAAVPAFNYITGSRSTDSAENIVAAMLQRARSQAIQDRRITGIAFFLNPRDQRATLALVTKSTAANGIADDPYSNYRGWTQTSFQQNPSGTGLAVGGPPYDEGHETISLYHYDYGNTVTKDTAEQYHHVTRPFVHDNSAANTFANLNSSPPPVKAPWDAADGSTGTVEVSALDFVTDTEFETLPAGVAVQTVNDPKGLTNRDRYLEIGVILFDPDGRLISVPYAFRNGSQTFSLLSAPGNTNNFLPVSTLPANTVYSQLGVVLYDRAAFLNQPNATEGDFLLQSSYITPKSTTFANEDAEEKWLDQNTTPLFVNRGNGTLLKGQ